MAEEDDYLSTIIFDDIKKEYLILERGWSFPAWAPINRSYVRTPGGIGATSRKIETEELRFDLPVIIRSKTFEEKQAFIEDMAAWLIKDEPEALRFTRYPNRTLYAEVAGSIDFDQLWKFGKGTISFVCPDPYKYGNHQIDTFTTEKAIYSQGTAPALPIFNVHFTAASTNFQLTNNGQTFRLIREFTAGDRVVIDCKRGLVQLNGLDAMPIRDWRTPFKRLLLEPGENQLTAGPGADVEVTFTERYL